MPYDEGLATRLREILSDTPAITEKKMFGGLAFMAGGHMCVGIAGEALLARVGPDAYPAALARPHAREMDLTGKPMRGYVLVDPPGYEADADLAEWVRQGLDFVASLPPK